MRDDPRAEFQRRLIALLYTFLTTRERDVLMHRYGFLGRALTPQDTADVLGLSETQVRMLERRALEKLQGPFLLEVLRYTLLETGRAWGAAPPQGRS